MVLLDETVEDNNIQCIIVIIDKFVPCVRCDLVRLAVSQ